MKLQFQIKSLLISNNLLRLNNGPKTAMIMTSHYINNSLGTVIHKILHLGMVRSRLGTHQSFSTTMRIRKCLRNTYNSNLNWRKRKKKGSSYKLQMGLKAIISLVEVSHRTRLYQKIILRSNMTRKTKQKSWKEPMNFLKQDFLST